LENRHVSKIQAEETWLEVSRAILGTGKAISLQAWAGSEGSRMLRLPDFKTVGA